MSEKKTLKYAGQNCDYHPSVVVTASTGKQLQILMLALYIQHFLALWGKF